MPLCHDGMTSVLGSLGDQASCACKGRTLGGCKGGRATSCVSSRTRTHQICSATRRAQLKLLHRELGIRDLHYHQRPIMTTPRTLVMQLLLAFVCCALATAAGMLGRDLFSTSLNGSESDALSGSWTGSQRVRHHCSHSLRIAVSRGCFDAACISTRAHVCWTCARSM